MNLEVLKSKTALAALVGLVTSVAGVALGDVTAWQGIQTGVLALVAIFLRAAVGNVADTATAAQQAAQQAADAVQAAKSAPAGEQGAASAFIMPAAGEK